MRAIVVGSGPNGLTAAVVLARAGLDVTVLEANHTIGGGARSAELTLSGFTHDICSAIHPMATASPVFRALELESHGLEWIDATPVAHPLDGERVVLLQRSLDATARGLGRDERAYIRFMKPLVDSWEALLPSLLAPLIPPRHPIRMARFGLKALRSADGLARARFEGAQARAMFAGIAAHSMLPLTAMGSASFGLVLAMAGHAVGWPMPRGGSQSIADSLARLLSDSSGSIVTGHRVSNAGELRNADVVLFDITPRQLIAIAGDILPSRYRRKLERFRYGPAAFKVDWALSQPIPWRSEETARAGTVHIGGTIDEIATSEHDVASGRHPEKPFVLLAQQSLFDDSRAPAGKHTGWAYCHVPNGSTVDMTDRIEAQVERFAPGFRETILARSVLTPAQLEQHDANYIGGDIVGGANDLWQTLARPTLAPDPYAIPVKGWFLCSSSTPPGGGVHGMCGYHAAQSALRSLSRSKRAT
jgi:phytoene dehydrogenase-like protein